jgi:hypothetical protein
VDECQPLPPIRRNATLELLGDLGRPSASSDRRMNSSSFRKRRKLKLKAKFEFRPSYFSFIHQILATFIMFRL